jgi:hypothetical protein
VDANSDGKNLDNIYSELNWNCSAGITKPATLAVNQMTAGGKNSRPY